MALYRHSRQSGNPLNWEPNCATHRFRSVTKQRILPRQAILIVNTASRSGADAFDQARNRLVAEGVALIDAQAIDDPEALEGEVRSAIHRAPMVIVGGGDGSLSATADHFLGTEVVFALLPLGTANSFARTLGIPLDVEGAIDVIAHGEVRRIDLAAIDGDYFLNNAALGLAPAVAESVPRGLKRSFGRLGYLLWAGWSAANFRAFRLKVDDGEHTHWLWATEARIANGRFHGGVELIESADLQSGEIVVQAVRGRSLARLGWSYLTSALKVPSRHESLCEFRGTKMRIETRPRMRVSIDGELGPETPFVASVVPDAIFVAAPRPNPPD